MQIPSDSGAFQYDANTIITDPPMQSVLADHGLLDATAIWETWRGDDLVPRWGNVDLLVLPEALRQGTMVADYLAGDDDFEVRFWGVGLVQAFQIELTGMRLSQAFDRGVMSSFKKTAVQIIREKRPVYMNHAITSAGGVVRLFPVVRLPISDDGSAVSKIMTIENIIRCLTIFTHDDG